jgi:hypothetical protein
MPAIFLHHASPASAEHATLAADSLVHSLALSLVLHDSLPLTGSQTLGTILLPFTNTPRFNWDMKPRSTGIKFLCLSALLTVICPAFGDSPNQLSEEEKVGGWKLLFDGKTTQGWHTFKKHTFPKKVGTCKRPGCMVWAKAGAIF